MIASTRHSPAWLYSRCSISLDEHRFPPYVVCRRCSSVKVTRESADEAVPQRPPLDMLTPARPVKGFFVVTWPHLLFRRSIYSPTVGSTDGILEMSKAGKDCKASKAMPMASEVTQFSTSPALSPLCKTSGFQSALFWPR